MINKDVVPLVYALSIGKHEMCRVIDSWLGIVACCVESLEGELEGASWILWLDGTADGEVVTPKHMKPLVLGPRPLPWREILICLAVPTDLETMSK